MQGPIQVISIHALREEGDHGLGQRQSTCQQFLSTPSARRATRGVHQAARPSAISIHALREEGDLRQGHPQRPVTNFYPRPPRGGRPIPPQATGGILIFLSTPSARRATNIMTAPLSRILFLSTPSARRATRIMPSLSNIIRFLSTPSARRATYSPYLHHPGEIFLSTPSARRATLGRRNGVQ